METEGWEGLAAERPETRTFADIVRLPWRKLNAQERDCFQGASEDALITEVGEDYAFILDGDQLEVFGPECHKMYMVELEECP